MNALRRRIANRADFKYLYVQDVYAQRQVMEETHSSLTGQLLVAMPQTCDPFFARSVVYLCAHSTEDGAMGLIVNKLVDSFTIGELYSQLKIEPTIRSNRPQAVHFGGPVSTDQAFVLHSADYRCEGTLKIGDEFAMTATPEILQATARGEGPRQYLVAFGYAGWGPGQLDAEIQANGWLSVAADACLVFDDDDDSKWQRTLAKLGVSLGRLSADSGRA